MSVVQAHYVTCDAPGCEEKIRLTPTQYEERYTPFKWIRTRTWDTNGPWEDREYDVCCPTCLTVLFAEAHELRYEFDSSGSDADWYYSDEEEHDSQ